MKKGERTLKSPVVEAIGRDKKNRKKRGQYYEKLKLANKGYSK